MNTTINKSYLILHIVQNVIDYIHRKQLTGECGFNQKGYDILLQDTYVQVKEIKELCNWSTYSKEINRQENLRKKHWTEHFKLVVEVLDGAKKGASRIKNAYRKTSKLEIKKYYAGLIKISTTLKIRNRLPVYNDCTSLSKQKSIG